MGLKRRRYPNSGLFLIERINPAATQSFTNIPQDFQDLRLIISGTGNGGPMDVRLRFNSDSGANYDFLRNLGNGNTNTFMNNVSQTDMNIGRLGGGTPQGGHIVADIVRYAGTDARKYVTSQSVSYDGDALNQAYLGTHAGRWKSTVAITRIDLIVAFSIDAGSASLYGIR